MTVKTVIFDIGGVLIRSQNRQNRLAWERKLGLAEWESENIVFNSEMGIKAQTGLITDEALWVWVQERLNLETAEFEAFRADFWADDVLDEGMVAYIRSLRPAYGTAVISNATDALRHRLTYEHPIADAFDLIVVSGEEKVMKPDATIYQTTLARLGRQPEETVFIDDFAHNIAAAAALGMHTVHFNPTVDLSTELAKIGVVPQEGSE